MSDNISHIQISKSEQKSVKFFDSRVGSDDVDDANNGKIILGEIDEEGKRIVIIRI